MTRKRTRKAAANPFTLGLDALQLSMDAASVIAMRSTAIALGGPDGQREAETMVTEKMEAAWDLGLSFAFGGFAHTPHTAARRTLAHYGKRVRANRRRLARPK